MALGEVIEFKGNKKVVLPKEGSIEFKGSKKGLVINIKECNEFEKVKEELVEKIGRAGRFFKGAKIASINSTTLNDIEILHLKDIITSKFEVEFLEEKEEENKAIFEGINEGPTKFVKSTIRSGTKIEFKGNVVIIGDINPGGQVIAYGNIVIMGSLRGVVHAGANGNRNAFVAAYNLDPMQLRIADIIAIAPEENFKKPNYPEIAFIKDDYIIIEPYLSKK
ncbi:septum site-determining protein MinC [Tepidibacter formicigenes]|jgi:septum site-determining protein MinC|uniref:Probable septum site-determining protein MinC n=1 Tax=Tepidibacter formicigenes DSM 15518 TaxID=1123349 RepID=A0A1M6K116_9FIRM|nr:septum site-determining protein MinC [Tepidibacter formicigenes]SHJ52625.1 septum site-determining protein MinC [Tepidibacter formicigenes DSM 15518]